MKDLIFEHMAAEFPFLAREAVEYHSEGYEELVVKLRDGQYILYDDFSRTFRRLPPSYNLSEEDFKIEFGNRLCKLMALKGINQIELAERTGITQPALSNYISGKTNPHFYAVDKIAKVLGCSVDEFRYIERD